MSFKSSFNNARNSKLQYFEWNGKIYNTKKTLDDSEWNSFTNNLQQYYDKDKTLGWPNAKEDQIKKLLKRNPESEDYPELEDDTKLDTNIKLDNANLTDYSNKFKPNIGLNVKPIKLQVPLNLKPDTKPTKKKIVKKQQSVVKQDTIKNDTVTYNPNFDDLKLMPESKKTEAPKKVIAKKSITRKSSEIKSENNGVKDLIPSVTTQKNTFGKKVDSILPNPFEGTPIEDAWKVWTNPDASILSKVRRTWNGLVRKHQKSSGKGDAIVKQEIKKKIVSKPKEPVDTTLINGVDPRSIHQTSWNVPGDTLSFEYLSQVSPTNPNSNSQRQFIRGNSDRYIIPENIDLTTLKFGHRNNGDYTPIKSKAGLLTFSPKFYTASEYKQNIGLAGPGYWTHFIGHDKNGKIKLGTIDQFDGEDFVSPVQDHFYYHGFKLNNDGSLYLSGNDYRKSPVVYGDSGNGIQEKSLLISGGTDREGKQFNTKNDTFGFVAGGGVVARCGNEVRLIRGSVNQVKNGLDEMQSRHKQPLELFIMDNGSYAGGLRTFSGIFNEHTLRRYDEQNDGTAGGNIMYVMKKGGGLHSPFGHKAPQLDSNMPSTGLPSAKKPKNKIIKKKK